MPFYMNLRQAEIRDVRSLFFLKRKAALQENMHGKNSRNLIGCFESALPGWLLPMFALLALLAVTGAVTHGCFAITLGAVDQTWSTNPECGSGNGYQASI